MLKLYTQLPEPTANRHDKQYSSSVRHNLKSSTELIGKQVCRGLLKHKDKVFQVSANVSVIMLI